MDHQVFKAKQTAAVYVADGLDENTLEAFEMHMMGCQECVEDVETWRAIRLNMPVRSRNASVAVAPARRSMVPNWAIAASLVGAVGLGGGFTAGWFGEASVTPNIDSTRTVVFNMPAVTRGWGDCTHVQFAPNTQLALVRVSDVPVAAHVVALDADKRELSTSQYSSRSQPDGSALLKVPSAQLLGRTLHLEVRGANGSIQPVGCITGVLPASEK